MKWQGGNSNVPAFLAIGGLLLLSAVGAAISPDTSERSESPRTSLASSRPTRSVLSQNEEVFDITRSPYYGQIRISAGNGRSAYQPYLEYITIQRNSSKDENPINITGWSVENGASSRKYQIGYNVFFGNSSRVYIPQGANLFIPGAQNTLGPILLKPGDKAVLLTGSMPPVTDYTISSFRVNKCSGYIEEDESVKFSPAISRSCPDYRAYPEVNDFERSCYDFVRRMRRCHTPELKDVRRPDGGLDVGTVDGVLGLTNSCKAFIQTTFNYNSCVARHLNDEDFYKKEWRVFLGQPWELWAKERETITLYDQSGRIVNQTSY